MKGILLPIKKHGNNGKDPILYNSYRINRAKLSEAYIYTLLEELDKENFTNEEGLEDLQKVKKYIKLF